MGGSADGCAGVLCPGPRLGRGVADGPARAAAAAAARPAPAARQGVARIQVLAGRLVHGLYAAVYPGRPGAVVAHLRHLDAHLRGALRARRVHAGGGALCSHRPAASPLKREDV